jgi:hypothetical protein
MGCGDCDKTVHGNVESMNINVNSTQQFIAHK